VTFVFIVTRTETGVWHEYDDEDVRVVRAFATREAAQAFADKCAAYFAAIPPSIRSVTPAEMNWEAYCARNAEREAYIRANPYDPDCPDDNSDRKVRYSVEEVPFEGEPL
jgi:hypothetical protein